MPECGKIGIEAYQPQHNAQTSLNICGRDEFIVRVEEESKDIKLDNDSVYGEELAGIEINTKNAKVCNNDGVGFHHLNCSAIASSVNATG